MANPFRKSSSKFNFVFVLILSTLLMVVDSNTRWLQAPRNILSVVLSPIQTLATIPSTFEGIIDGAISSEPDIKIAYDNLRDEYFQLKAETLLLRTLQDENTDLRLLLDASERLNEKITLAELINVSIDPYNHRVLIGRGLTNHVYVGQAVIDDQGVIGQVTEVMPLSSGIMLITDPGHAIPVQVQRNGLRTIAFGTGDVSSLRVSFLNQNSDIVIGDVLISSGLGGRFPNGYPVATISDVKVIEEEAYISVIATPIGKLDRSNHVLLLSRDASNKVVNQQNDVDFSTDSTLPSSTEGL